MPKSHETITISIDASSVRFLTTLNGQIARFGSLPLAAGLIVDGVVSDAAELGRILDHLLREQGLGRDDIIVGIDALRSIPRILTLPNVQKNVLEQAVQRTVRKEMPVSLDTLYLAWQELPSGPEERRIYTVGVPRETVDSHVAALQNATIKPYLMDLRPLALARAIQAQNAIIVSLEPRVLDIILIADWIPIMVRTFGIDSSVRTTKDRVQLLATETDQTIRYYNDSHRDHTLGMETPLYVTGGLIESPELLDECLVQMDRRVSLPEPPIPCPKELSVPTYFANIGLSMKKKA